MIVFETQRTRRIVGRLERGEDVLGAVQRLCRDHRVRGGWIRAVGAFEWVELCEYDQRTREYKPALRFDTPCEILSLEGNVSIKDDAPFVHLHATVSRETDNGIQVLGGHLTGGAAFSCELVLDTFDDIDLVRVRDHATGLSLWDGTQAGRAAPPPGPVGRPATPAPSGGGGVSWADVAAASQVPPQPPPKVIERRRPTTPPPAPKRARETPDTPAFTPGPLPERRRPSEEEIFEEHYPEKGDWVDHKQFGLCRVDGEDSEGSLLIRLPSGVRKPIKLDYLEVLPPHWDGERRIFPLRPKNKR